METANRGLENASLSRPPPPAPAPSLSPGKMGSLRPACSSKHVHSPLKYVMKTYLFTQKKSETNEPAWALTGNPRFQAGAEFSGSPAR